MASTDKKARVVLYAPEKFWQCDSELLDRITGGCGPGGFGDLLIPDTMYGLSVKPACRIHDFYYSPMMPATLECKAEGDRVFLNNMVRIIQAKTKSKILKRLRLGRAKTYYVFVRDLGGSSFWRGKNNDACLRAVEL